MTEVFHEGEQLVQRLAGVEEDAAQVGKIIQHALPTKAQAFLTEQTLGVAASVAANNQVWASVLTGKPGFLRVIDAGTLQFAGPSSSDDPLWKNLQQRSDVGLLVLDPATRRRMRANGQAVRLPAGDVLLRISQAFSNCPKYIQRRVRIVDPGEHPAIQAQKAGNSLDDHQQAWVRQADTFFIGSTHPHRGADASHRGGQPGFVQVVSPTKLLWPDYPGNNMFQTLGNVAVQPEAGLLFLDWETGSTLQMTGRATIVWDQELASQYPGAERLVEFEIEQVIETNNATPFRWQLVENSPYNPSVEVCER